MSEEIIFDELSVNEEGQSHRTVRIAERAGSPNQLYQVIAFLGTYNVRVSRMSDDTRAKSFQLSADEMDTLAAQWIKFREDCISAREAEEKRVAEVKAEAFKLVEEEAPFVEVSEEVNSYYNTTYWRVGVEEISYSAKATTVDQLLESVRTAMDQYIAHTLRISEVKAIAKAHREIKVMGVKTLRNGKHWTVSIPDMEGPYAEPSILYNSTDLLTTIKEALAWLEQQQSECAQSAAQVVSDSTVATNSLTSTGIDSQHNS